jgi:cytochrome c peroxidase
MHEHRRSSITLLSLTILGVGACTTEGGPAPPDEAQARVPAPLETTVAVADATATNAPALGAEVAIAQHLKDGDEYRVSLKKLLRHGQLLFEAVVTPQDGAGRPLSKGTGDPLSDPTSPLVFPRAFNRLSAMDANSCASCHSVPLLGGGGHFTANAFLIGQRFDFLTFNHADNIPTRGAVDERGLPVLLQSFNSRAALGMLGSGFIEMLARQITADLRVIRDGTPSGATRTLSSKGISYGRIGRRADGSWDTSAVVGIPASSLVSSGPLDPPSMTIRAFHQSGSVISIRQFTNNAFNHHLGLQSTERFGIGTDPDGDGFTNELTRADVTAASVFQATLPIPGRVIPTDSRIEQAVLLGERRFSELGCATCHLPSLPLDQNGWIFSEPNPFNLPGNLRPGDAPALSVDLTSSALPGPRLKPRNGVVMVPAFTDLKLHDITTGPGDPNIDPLDMNQPTGSAGFFAGNAKFLTKKLWGCANEPPFFHHGMFPTLRQAILAHAGEANSSAQAFRALSAGDQGAVIEFLKTLRGLPDDAEALIVDEDGHAKTWPPHS